MSDERDPVWKHNWTCLLILENTSSSCRHFAYPVLIRVTTRTSNKSDKVVKHADDSIPGHNWSRPVVRL